jgi:predicted ATPase
MVATEHGLQAHLSSAIILNGWTLAQEGNLARGIAQMREGLSAYEATAGPLVRPWYVGLLADALGQADRVDEALEKLDRALAAVERTGERWCEAELYRMRGEMSLRSKPRRTRLRRGARPAEVAADACFRRAIEIARRQAAKAWEVRATISLARLRQRQGRLAEAREALADVQQWLTEGFDTPDLKAARALAAELG